MSPSFGSSTCGRSWCSTGGPLSHIRWRSCGQCQGFHHHAYRRGAWALLGRRYGYVNARRVSRDHPERRQSCADGAGVELELSTTRNWSCASRGTSRCLPPQHVHHRVLGHLQAHGNGPRARHYDPLRIRHARARHGLRHNVCATALEYVLRLRIS